MTGLALGFVHVVYGFALKIVLDLDLAGTAHRASIWLAVVVAAVVGTVALVVLSTG